MRKTCIAVLLILHLAAISINSQVANARVVLIKAGRLIDVRAGRVLENQGVLVEGQRIKLVGAFADVESFQLQEPEMLYLDRWGLLLW